MRLLGAGDGHRERLLVTGRRVDARVAREGEALAVHERAALVARQVVGLHHVGYRPVAREHQRLQEALIGARIPRPIAALRQAVERLPDLIAGRAVLLFISFISL